MSALLFSGPSAPNPTLPFQPTLSLPTYPHHAHSLDPTEWASANQAKQCTLPRYYKYSHLIIDLRIILDIMSACTEYVIYKYIFKYFGVKDAAGASVARHQRCGRWNVRVVLNT